MKLSKQIKKAISMILIIAMFTLQIGVVWAAEELSNKNGVVANDNAKKPSREELLKAVNKAHGEVDAMKARLLSSATSEMDKFLANKMTTDFHGQINDYYGEVEVAPVSMSQNSQQPVDVLGNKGGSSSGSGASSQNTTPVSGLGGFGSGSGASAAGNGNGGILGTLNNALGNTAGSSTGSGASSSNGTAGSSTGSGASSSSSNGGGILSSIGGALGGLFGGGSSTSNSNGSGGIGGFISNIFGGNGGFGNILANVAGSLSGSSNGVLSTIGNTLSNGVTANGSFSFKAMIFNTIWNLLSKWLMKKISGFINSLAAKIQTKLTSLINNLNVSNIPLVGNWLGNLQQTASTWITTTVNNLKTKALQFVQSMLTKAKTAIKNKLGI